MTNTRAFLGTIRDMIAKPPHAGCCCPACYLASRKVGPQPSVDLDGVLTWNRSYIVTVEGGEYVLYGRDGDDLGARLASLPGIEIIGDAYNEAANTEEVCPGKKPNCPVCNTMARDVQEAFATAMEAMSALDRGDLRRAAELATSVNSPTWKRWARMVEEYAARKRER